MRERVRWTTDLCAQRKKREVAYELRGGFIIEDAIVCLDVLSMVGIEGVVRAICGRREW